ncbi:MAG: hypothetical protein M3N05_08025, partial [Pseudomonadota bacterium]|nr:hypothetical protein [Pseudomonadota bacterium]
VDGSTGDGSSVESNTVPVWSPDQSLKWTPNLHADPSQPPPNQMQIYGFGGDPKGARDRADKLTEAQTGKASKADDQIARLTEMQHQYQSLPSSGFLRPGAMAPERLEGARALNTAIQALGGSPVFNEKDVAAMEATMKDTSKLGFDMVQGMGREPGFIVERAIGANPSIANTPLGFARITAGLREAAQYERDKAEFYQDYQSKWGHLDGADIAFRKQNPKEMYANRAILSTVDPRDAKAVMDHARDPEAARALDKKYGTGTAKLVLGGQ